MRPQLLETWVIATVGGTITVIITMVLAYQCTASTFRLKRTRVIYAIVSGLSVAIAVIFAAVMLYHAAWVDHIRDFNR